MRRGLHPYALIFGIVIGVMVLATLRHPLFAVFSGVVAIVLLDLSFKKNSRKNE